VVETARAQAARVQHGAILEAVAFAAERLLLIPDWREAAEEVLSRIGEASGVSRAYIIENHFDEDERLLGSLRAEWCAPGIGSQWGDPYLTQAPWDELPRWQQAHTAGEPMITRIADLPSDERREFDQQGIVTIAEHPVFCEGRWWGAIGFDDCVSEREWSDAELQALRATATLLGAAVTRQAAEDRRRRAEERWGQVVELIPAVTYSDVVDSDNLVRMGFVSPQVEELLGFPPERFLNDVGFWFSLIHPEDEARLQAAGAFDAADTEPFDQEYRMRHADGSYRWVHDTSTAVFREDGSLDHFLGFMVDITEGKEAELALRLADERFRTIVEQTPAVTYQEFLIEGIYDPETVETFVSPHVMRLLGFTPEEWRSPGFWRGRMHPDDLTAVDIESARVIEEGETTYRQEYRMIAKDGRILWFHDESVQISDEDGTPVMWQGVMLDITERREAEERLREAEERFRMLVEQTPAIVYLEPFAREASGTTTYVSPQIEHILGFQPDRWVEPGAWIAGVHPDDRERVSGHAEAITGADGPYSDEYRMIAADGRTVWFHDEAVLVRDGSGSPLMWQGVMVDISERKEAEHRLEGVQKRYQALVEHLPVIVYAEAIVANSEDLYLSPQVEEILGFTADEWRYTSGFWLDHIHPDDQARVRAANDRANQAGEAFIEEYRFRAADGTYRWLRDEAVRVQSDDGDALFWQGVFLDITERKQAEENLREAEARYRALVEHIPAVVYTESIDGAPEKFYISPQVSEVFGYSADEWRWTENFWLDHVHPDDLANVIENDRTTNISREPYIHEYRFRHEDGRWVWVRDEATFVTGRDDEGFWQGFLLDVTERREAEEQLRETELKFRTIVEQNQAIFYTQEIDLDDPSISRTTYIAPGNTDMIGYSLEDVRDDPTLWRKLIHPDDRERVFAEDATSNEGGGDRFSSEYRMIARDGRIVWVQDEATLVRLPGKPPYWQGFLLDVTERKEAEAQLERALDVEREATQRLRALDEMKNTFLQAVSHDLRTPLAAILGLAITLERGDVQLNESDARDLAHRIAGNARRLDRLVMNLLDLDRLARGIVSPKLEEADIAEIVRRVVDETQLVEGPRLHTDLRSAIQPVDGAKVERIVENLLANTVRHTPADAEIWVSVRPEPTGVLIVVEDDGPGVSEGMRETIFEPFRQGPDAPQHSPGVGVGLTLVRRFAELHGGRAWVTDREGGGASFRVSLPARRHADVLPPPEPSDQPPQDGVVPPA
jgi:PAS domain S-box-containing protein